MARTGLAALNTPALGAPFRAKRLGFRAGVVLALLGPVFAIATIYAFDRADQGQVDRNVIRIVLLADLVYILALVAMIAWTIGRAIAARRARSAGSRLHLRLSGLFTLVALVPTVLVAVFATLTVNFGMEAWFSDRVRSVVRNSLETAEAYAREHRGSIEGEALAMANDLNRAGSVGIDPATLGELVRRQALIRELPEAYVLDGSGGIIARGEFSYLFTLETPTPQQFAAAREGEVVVIEDEENNELRALVHLTGFIDSYLYVTRRIEGDVLMLLDETRATVALYERLEEERDNVLFDFALLYLGFATLVLLGAVWLGLWFAERLARPIGRLAGAAERVGGGDFDVRVKEERGDDEISTLSQAFNRMTRQLKRQREALVAARDETESRRRFIETVLSGVSAGVIGLDPTGRVELANEAAAAMLGLRHGLDEGAPIETAAPALAELWRRTRRGPAAAAQDQIRVTLNGRERVLLARITPKGRETDEGAVLTIDDLTELVSAQRMAAWGDVARRIAHEIKNPLTPIQLSADRLKRKFSTLPPEDRAALEQYADVIVRQAGDIRRMVDEFSKFARMPAPEARAEDLAQIVRGVALLQQEGAEGVRISVEAPGPLPVFVDRGLIGQAATNMIKNAVEAVQARLAATPGGPPGVVQVRAAVADGAARIEVADNGVGLPEGDPARLAEPYVTTRAKGTGLGLAIVKKIAEQHGGRLSLGPAPPFDEGAAAGALAAIEFPAGAPDAARPGAPRRAGGAQVEGSA
jgi:two-component system nitrogen regulation sensor histidine kinase NtrY